MPFRLFRHILLSDQHNISVVQDLTEKTIKHCGQSQKISTKKLSLELPALFPNIVKSKVRRNDNTMKISFRMQLLDEIYFATLTFADIPNNMPNDWFTISKTTYEFSFGHKPVLAAKCNGQGIILKVTLGSNRSVSAAIANQTLDLHQYGIPYNIAYTRTSIQALF